MGISFNFTFFFGHRHCHLSPFFKQDRFSVFTSFPPILFTPKTALQALEKQAEIKPSQNLSLFIYLKTCSSCHALGGSMPNRAGFVGIYGRFPQYNSRADAVITLEDRINGCFERSMNGRKMPVDSEEMKAMVAYMYWISQGIPVGAKTKGQGLEKVTFLSRPADPKKGKIVYQEKCSLPSRKIEKKIFPIGVSNP